MQGKPTSGRMKRHQFAIGIVLLVALLLPAIPARALIGVTETDSVHSNVGAIWWIIADCDDDGENEEVGSCIPPDNVPASGILIAPNVVLTNATNSINTGRRVGVSFASPVDHDDFGNTVYRGFYLRNPNFGGWRDFPGSYNHDNNFDMGVVILDEPVTGITPANLASLGALDAFKRTKKTLTAVGYGTTNSRGGNQEWTWDWMRRAATWELSGLKPSFVHTTAPGQHGPCDGDQGGPILADGAVAALMVNWDGICGAKGVGLGYRVDTTDAYEFLCNLSSQAWVNALKVENRNAPFIPGEFLEPSVAPSAIALAAYCNIGGASVQAASADNGGTAADQPKQSNHKHKSGGGKQHNKGKGKHRK